MSDSDLFARARFVGRRFAGGSLDLDAVPELLTYKRVIVEVAKWLFREDHRDRQRVPRGFERSFSLALTAVTDGSATAELMRVDDRTQLPLGEHDRDYFERARTRVNEIIDRAGRAESIDDVPSAVLRVLEQLGTFLGVEESLEIMPRDAANGARYDRAVRRNISLAITSQYEEKVETFGVIVAVDRERRTFAARLSEEQKLDGRFCKGLDDELAHALDTKVYCRLQMTATYLRDGTLKRVELHEVEALDLEGPDFEYRLTELSGFGAGWLDGAGESVRQDEIEMMRRLLRLMVWDFGFVAPHLYPTERGGVRAEWSAGDWEVSLETKPSGQYDLHALDVRTDEEQERVDVAHDHDVLRFLRRYVKHDSVLDEVLGVHVADAGN